MATDWWPDQDGRIVDGCTVGFCYADSTSITANQAVKVGTSASGRLAVTVAAACGDGIGIALKAPVAVGDPVPVLFYGLMKLTACYGGAAATTGKISIGSFVMNSAVAGVCGGSMAETTLQSLACGASYILGLALQSATATSDEILVLVGKTA